MAIRPGSAPHEPRASAPTLYLASDHPPGRLRALHRSGVLDPVARGAYVAAGDLDRAPSVERETLRALARIRAVDQRLTAPHLFSHESAALVRGLPLWSPPRRTHVVQGHTAGGRRDRAVAWHLGDPLSSDRTVVDGLPVTTLARTILDCVRTLPPSHGLVVADAGLRAGASQEELLRMLDEMPGRRGVARARAVVRHADAGSESPGESMARFALLRAGFPVPATQVAVATRVGTFWGDLGWPAWRVLLEYDGRTKYRDRGDDVLLREKRRHDAIREAGWAVVRVVREDLVEQDGRPSDLPARVRRVLPPDVRFHPRRDLAR